MRSIFLGTLLLFIFSCALNALAQESDVPRSSTFSPQFNYQSIELPASDLSKFQLDNWIPIQSEEFDSLIRKIQSATDPADSCSIVRSRFSAEYRDGMLLDGSFVFSVRKFGKGNRPLLITPCTIPLREIAWRDRPASGGTSANGKGIISVDRESGELVGKWDLAPKHRGRGDEFELEFPQAAVSTFEILVPEEYGIKVNDPSISITKSESESGKRRWVIELGNRTTFRLEIFKEEKSGDFAPTIVCRQESSYSLRRDGVRLQELIQIMPIKGGVRELSFEVDRVLQVLSVSLGTDNPLQWEDKLNEMNSRIVKVKFPDPLFESGRQLTLQFVAPSQVGRDWQLPKVKLLKNVVENHRLSLRIDVPLELKRLTPIDCHQIGIDAADPPVRTFLSDGLDPGLELFVGAPELRTGCLVAGQVLCDREYWTGEFQLDFRATSGSVFSIPLRIQSGWEIIEVRAGVSSTSALSELVDWDVVNRPDLSQILTIDLQDALKAGSPCQIYVRVRRSAPTGEQAIAVPAIVPAFSTSRLDLLVRILHDRQSSAVLERGSSFDIVSDDLLPEPWNQSPFFLDRPQEPDRSAFVLKLNGEAVSGDMFVRSTQSNLAGIARVTADFTDDRIQEQMTLKISPQGRIDRVLVYLSESGEERKWSPFNAGALSIDAVRLPSSRHAIWHAPSEGELWELNLSTPQTEAFEIRGTRSSPREDRGRIPLRWVPEGEMFEGDVRITASGTDFPRLEVQPGEPLQFSRPNRRTGRGEPRIAEWRYIHSSQQEHTNSITYSYSRKSTATAAPPAASAKVVVRPGRNELSGDLYEIDFEFLTPVLLSQLGLSLPADAELIESAVDGTRSESVRRGDGTLFSVPSATHGRILKIKYSMPTSTKLGRVLFFPQPQFAISQVDWHLILPDGLALSRSPSAWGLADQQPTPVWKQIWSVSTEQTSATDSNSNSFESLPSDRTMTSRTHSLPAQVELQLWDRTVFVPAAWLSFLICVGFRLVSRQWKFFHARPSLVPGCIVALSLSIYWFPPGWSFVVFAGMIGLIIGTIAPRWWIPPKLEMPQGENRTLADEGTRIMSLPSSASMLSLAIVLSTSLRAQEISDAKTDDTAIRTTQSTDLQPNPIRKVLIPVPDNVKSDSNHSLLYLSPDWKPLIDRFSGTEELTAEQSYLIRSANHDLHVNDDGDIVYRLVLDIESPDSDFPPELTIPLSNIRFGGEQSCLVDGVPSSIFAVPGKPAVRISLGISSENPDSDRPTVEAKQKLRRRIELRGFPIIKGNAQAWTWESEIPIAVDSLFEAHFNRPTEDFQVPSALGTPAWDSEHRHLQVALGSVSKLNIAFHPQATNASADTKVDLVAIGQLEVTP
ncbi:MAG: hypothetical protein KDA36_01935, partial [Planctomycetaceae bacterium]|nr:hypothetical protein [Planctomycetaceae bacterium]